MVLRKMKVQKGKGQEDKYFAVPDLYWCLKDATLLSQGPKCKSRAPPGQPAISSFLVLPP